MNYLFGLDRGHTASSSFDLDNLIGRPNRRSLLVGASGAIGSLLIGPPLFAQRQDQIMALHSPYEVVGRRERFGRKGDEIRCKPVPPPVIVMDHQSKYAQGTSSSVEDSKAEKTYKAKLEPVSDFANPLVRIADRYVQTSPEDPEIANCALQWMHAWAQADAMTDIRTHQGYMVMTWTLGSIATSWLKIAGAEGLDATAKARVARWIGQLAAMTRGHFATDQDKNSRNNNHLYWAGWSVMAAAVVTQDAEAFDWSVGVFRQALSAIQPDGVLPLEMMRRRKALHYHQFALGPLVMMAETMTRNGEPDAYVWNDNRLHRLAMLVVAGLEDPEWFAGRAGEKQDMAVTIKTTQLAWMEPWQARFPEPRLVPWLQKYRPLVAHRLGGDLSFLFGVGSAGSASDNDRGSTP